MKLESVPCHICGEIKEFRLITKAKSLHSQEYFNVVTCKDCGLIFVNPRQDFEEKRASLESLDNVNYFEKTKERDDYIYETVLSDIDNITPKGKLLEVGCATGSLLRKAMGRGWEAYGVEINRNCARFARENNKLNVITGELQDAKFPSGYFDVVVMVHVIEHIYNPRELISEVNRILKQGGIVYMLTPNFSNYIVRFLKKIGVSRSIDELDPTGHPYMFTKYSLSKILEQSKFEVRYIDDGISLLSLKKKLADNGVSYLNKILKMLVSPMAKLGGGSSLKIIGQKI